MWTILAAAALHAQPMMKVADNTTSFGHVKRGVLIRNVYHFENTGDQPLMITGVETGGCTCTSAEFPKHPVLPGNKDSVIVLFNTTTVYGRQDRMVYVQGNYSGREVKLRFKGSVAKKKE